MRQPLALALALIFIPAVACAQRGGSHGGGFSAPRAASQSNSAPALTSHTAPAFHGNFTTASRYSGSLARSGTQGARGGAVPFRTRGSTYGPRSTFRISPAATRPPFYSRSRAPHPPRSPYRYGSGAGVPYIYPLWLGPSYFDDSADEPDDSADMGTPGVDAYADVQPGEPYPPMAEETEQPAAAEPPPPEPDAVTLIFKDGRPPQQVRNYALTRTTLYVIGAHHRDSPVADLDLDATEKANREAGVDFQLPEPTP